MSAFDPKLYADYIDTMVYHLGGAPDARNQSIVRAAIQNAYRDVSLRRNWNYFWQKYRIDFHAPYNTGSVQYVLSTNTLTLSGGTFPSWAGSGYASVRMNNIVSRIPYQTIGGGGTTLVLDSINSPPADLAAGTGYNLYQSLYPLPADFRLMCKPSPEVLWWWSEYIDPEEWNLLERQGVGCGSTGTPTRWTVIGDPTTIGGRVVAVWPYPNLSNTYDFMYQRLPRPINRTGIPKPDNQGTVTASAASTTVTGAGTAFIQAHVGAAIRFSINSTVPTGRDGLNPYQEQATIASVQSPTQLTTVTPLVNAYTAAGYLISDPIDFAQHMLTPLERGIELEIANKKDRANVMAVRGAFQESLKLAFEADLPFLSERFMDAGLMPVRPTLKYMPYTPPSVP